MSSFCIICSDKFRDSDDIVSTTCGHIYHSSCITQWLGQSRTCPQCRSELPEPDAKLLRLYFNLQDDESGILNCDDEILTLRDTSVKKEMKIDSLNEEIKKIKHYLKIQEGKYAKELSEYQEKVVKLEQENSQLQNNLEGLKDVQAAVCGCQHQVRKMVDKCIKNQNIDLIAAVCIQLKQTNEILLTLTQQRMEDFFPSVKRKRKDNTTSENASSDSNMTPGSSKSH